MNVNRETFINTVSTKLKSYQDKSKKCRIGTYKYVGNQMNIQRLTALLDKLQSGGIPNQHQVSAWFGAGSKFVD